MNDVGEFEAFACAVTPRLLRSARLLCGDDHLAEDLVQETLAKVYLRWTRPLTTRIDNPAAYAHTTLTRTYISLRRRRSSTERVSPPDALSDTPPPTEPGTLNEAEAADLRIVLDRGLQTLSPTDRAVLVLRYLEDLSVAETAAVLGIRPGAVRSRTHRALPHLAAALGVDVTVLTSPLEGELR